MDLTTTEKTDCCSLPSGSIKQTQHFLWKLAIALVQFSSASHCVVRQLDAAARSLGVERQSIFVYGLSNIVCSFPKTPTSDQVIRLVSARGWYTIAPNALREVWQTYARVLSGELTAMQGAELLEEIVARPDEEVDYVPVTWSLRADVLWHSFTDHMYHAFIEEW